MKVLAMIVLGTTGCLSKAVSPDPTGDYTQWTKKIVATGELPGHWGDTYRIIFANEIATKYAGGAYPDGTILVKEIHDLDLVNGVPAPGALQYVAIMRRLGPQPAGFSDEGGWLFTYTDTPQGPESEYDPCWATCHRAAPFAGAWFDYSK